MKRNVLLLLAAAAVIVFVAGCGSSSSSTTSTAKEPSNAEFASQASAVLCPAQAEAEALTKPTNATEVASYTEELVKIVEGVKTKLEAITVPKEKKAAAAKLLSLGSQEIVKVGELGQAAKAGETAKIEALEKEIAALSNEAKAVEKEVGVTECPKGSSTSTTGESTTGESTAGESTSSTGEEA